MSFDRNPYLSACKKPNASVKRKGDYQKEAKNERTLFKSSDCFLIDSTGMIFSGGTTTHTFWKKPTNSRKSLQRYYLNNRYGVWSSKEYIAYEILNAIGFTTPKLRFTRNSEGEVTSASKGLPGYLPVSAYLPKKIKLADPVLIRIANQFTFEEKEQRIIDKKLEIAYRIHGNLYGARFGAMLVNDPDFQAYQENCGFVVDGNSFRFVVLDKESATFKTCDTFSDLEKCNDSFSQAYFPEGFAEQSLATVEKIYHLIADEGDKLSILYKIFFDARVGGVHKESCIQNFIREISIILSKIIPDSEKIENSFVWDFKDEVIDQFKSDILIPSKTLKDISSPDCAKEWADKIQDTFFHAYDKIAKTYKKQTIDFAKNRNFILKNISTDVRQQFDISLQYEHVLHNASLIIAEHSAKLTEFESREELRYKLVHAAVEWLVKINIDVSIDEFEDMIEDLRGHHYAHLFSDQDKQVISKNDLENKKLLDQLKNDLALKKTSGLSEQIDKLCKEGMEEKQNKRERKSKTKNLSLEESGRDVKRKINF